MRNIERNTTRLQISDALVKLGVPHGGCIPDIRAFSPREEEAPDMKVIGPAFTVEVGLS